MGRFGGGGCRSSRRVDRSNSSDVRPSFLWYANRAQTFLGKVYEDDGKITLAKCTKFYKQTITFPMRASVYFGNVFKNISKAFVMVRENVDKKNARP